MILVLYILESEVVSDSVSSLTSGGVVCGNLAAALRGKHRQRKPAWSIEVLLDSSVSFYSCH